MKAVGVVALAVMATIASAQNGIDYHGGPVILETPATYVIWYGDWTPTSPAVLIVTDFLQAVGGSPWQLINATYFDGAANRITGQSRYGVAVYDHYSRGSTLTDADIQTIITAHVGVDLPADTGGVYFFLTSGDVRESGPFGQFGVNYCGWHNWATINSQNIKYSFVGDASVNYRASCLPFVPTPNGSSGGDGMVNVIAHELVEAISDPNLNAWFDGAGKENADKCAWRFWKTYGTSNGGQANMRIGNRDYLIQMNWVNALGGYCAIADNSAHPPTVVMNSPAPGTTFTCDANQIQVPISGTVTDWLGDQTSGLVRLTVSWPTDIGGTQFSQGFFNSGETWVVSAPCNNGTAIVEGFDSVATPSAKITRSYSVGGAPPPPGPNTAPTISITSPAPGSTLTCGAVNFTAVAADQEQGNLTSQILWPNGATGGSTTINYGCGGPNLGGKTVVAAITDAGGLRTVTSVNFTIKGKK